MTQQHPYDVAFLPPAPVVPVRVGRPGGAAVTVPALLDTGADVSVIGEALARQLRLRSSDRVRVRGAGGTIRAATVYSAELQVDDVVELVEIVGLGVENLLGRDVLNRFVLTLDGPREVVDLHRGSRRRTSR